MDSTGALWGMRSGRALRLHNLACCGCGCQLGSTCGADSADAWGERLHWCIVVLQQHLDKHAVLVNLSVPDRHFGIGFGTDSAPLLPLPCRSAAELSLPG